MGEKKQKHAKATKTTTGMTHQQHIQTMNTIHSITLKIQKETRGRRFKEEYKLLDECLKILIKMRDMPWPFMDNSQDNIPSVPEWMDADANNNAEDNGSNDSRDRKEDKEEK